MMSQMVAGLLRAQADVLNQLALYILEQDPRGAAERLRKSAPYGDHSAGDTADTFDTQSVTQTLDCLLRHMGIAVDNIPGLIDTFLRQVRETIS